MRRILDRLLSCAGALSLRSSTRLEALHILEALVCDVVSVMYSFHNDENFL